MINGSTKLVGLIGDPVAHSLSPAMHNAAFAAVGLDWCYVPLHVVSSRMDKAVRGLAALGFCGANVTVPHKETVIDQLDVIDADAAEIGAVNTLVVHRSSGEPPRIEGYNTDVAGFVAALQSEGPRIVGERAVVIGAGGGARAAVAGLLQMGVAEIVIFGRNEKRAVSVAASFAEREGRIIPVLLSEEALVEAAGHARLLVNATPVGMWPDVESSVWPDRATFPRDTVVFDLVYNPELTHLLRQAVAAGARTVSGLEMLVAQGAISFGLWTGNAAPIDILRGACRQGLRRRSSCVS